MLKKTAISSCPWADASIGSPEGRRERAKIKMSLTVTCFYCAAKKKLEIGSVVKLACDSCASPRVILDRDAVFKCLLCKKTYKAPSGRQITAYHDDKNCRGRTLILVDHD